MAAKKGPRNVVVRARYYFALEQVADALAYLLDEGLRPPNVRRAQRAMRKLSREEEGSAEPRWHWESKA